jgi:hypothetical protein
LSIRFVLWQSMKCAESRTRDEEIETRLPEHLKQSAVAEHYGEQAFAELTVARIQETRQIEQRIEQENVEQQRQINAVIGGGRRARLLGGRRRR